MGCRWRWVEWVAAESFAGCSDSSKEFDVWSRANIFDGRPSESFCIGILIWS